MNLIRLADKIKSPLVFAHVRASTAGSVSESNCKQQHFFSDRKMYFEGTIGLCNQEKNNSPYQCFLLLIGHPWQYGRLMFMHNGNVADFHLVRKRTFLETESTN